MTSFTTERAPMSKKRSAPEESASAPGGANTVSEEMIRARAYEISQSGEAGTPDENWERAERELRGDVRATPPGEAPAA
jgi:hypothetical protein